MNDFIAQAFLDELGKIALKMPAPGQAAKVKSMAGGAFSQGRRFLRQNVGAPVRRGAEALTGVQFNR